MTLVALLSLVLALSSGLALAVPVSADSGTTHYVCATTGDDTGDGSQTTPWKTIQHAIDEVDPGDTIQVLVGIYNEAVEVHKDNLNIQGAEGAVIDGAGLGDVSAFTLLGSGITVEGFSITGFDWGGIDVYSWEDPQPSGNSIVGNVITDTWWGIYVTGDNHIIAGNEVTSIDWHGIWIFMGDQCSIVGNTVTGSTGYGIHIDLGGVHYVTGNVVTENDIGINWGGVPASSIGATANLNKIFSNHSFGMSSTANVDATLNWWGHASGPEHADNPGGTGDAIRGNVDFSPWYFLEDLRIPVTSYDDVDDTATGTGPARFGSSEGAIVNLRTVDEADLPVLGKPYLAFPHGFFALDIEGVTPGGEVTVSIMLPQRARPGTEYWKYYLGAWHQIPMTIDPNDSRIIHITLVDGGLGDASGVPDGRIEDQGGPGNPVTVGWEGSSVDRAAVLAPWLAVVVTVIAGATLIAIRRRRAQT